MHPGNSSGPVIDGHRGNETLAAKMTGTALISLWLWDLASGAVHGFSCESVPCGLRKGNCGAARGLVANRPSGRVKS